MTLITGIIEALTQLDFGFGGLMVAIGSILVTTIAITRNTEDIKQVAAVVSLAYGGLGIAVAPWLGLALGIFAVNSITGQKLFQKFITANPVTGIKKAVAVIPATPSAPLRLKPKLTGTKERILRGRVPYAFAGDFFRRMRR